MMKTDDYNDQSVTEEKLKDGAITTRKIADGSVTKDKLSLSIRQEINDSVTASNEATEKAKEATAKADQATENAKQATVAATAAKEAADTATQLATNATTASAQATEQAKAATTKAEEATVKANEAAQKADDSREQTEQTLGTMQDVIDKVSIKDDEGTVVETPFRYIQNEEFIFAKVDAEDKLLFGIQWDGTPKFCKTSAVEDRLQSQVTLLAERVATIMGDEDTTNVIDTMNELKKFFAEIENTETLTGILANLDNVAKNLDKTTIKDEAGNVQDTPFRVIENEEFIMAVVDSEDRYLFGIYRATGKPYYPQNDMYHISQSEEFLWVILDAANHSLLGIRQDGTCWAAKAQWLDDIKTIKEALSSIDETLKTFQPKEDGKGLINLDVADSFFYISNDEYVIAVVDAENRILAGIKYDGEPYFPNHKMYSVITNEEWLYAIIDAEGKVLGGFRADDGHMIVGGIDISTFIANAIIDIADIKERTAHLSTIENDEYISVETDSDGKVIGYIALDGSHYLYKVKSETIPEEFSHIEDPEGRTEITTDAENKILGYRDSKGTRHEHKISAKHLELSDEAANEVNEAFKSAGIKMENPSDFSKDSHIELPIPRIAAQVRLYAPKLPSTKQDDIEAEIEYNDKDGNYFRKPVILNAQGSSSMGYYVKNMAIDINDGSEIKFGDFPTQDSFHLKKYYIDIFRGQCIVGYWLMEQVYKSHPIGQQYPYEYTNLNESSIESSGDIKKDFFNGAKCHPDGFPIIIIWVNSETGEETNMGIYTWNLKKSKEVYNCEKKKSENIILDGSLNINTIFGGTVDWSAFEIRNPKSLIDIEGNKYDGDNPKELSETDPLSKKVKDYILRLSSKCKEINSASEEQRKTLMEEIFLIPPTIDYFLVSQIIYHFDGFDKNWIYLTLDGQKWCPTLYDVDSIFGQYWNGTFVIRGSDSQKILYNYPIHYLLTSFKSEIESRYNELRKKGIFTVENITSLLEKWEKQVGYDNYKNEQKLYSETPSYRPSYLNEGWELIEHDGVSNDYNNEKTYNLGDIASMHGYRFKATKEITGVPPVSREYGKVPTMFGFYNSLQRVKNWLNNRIKFLDATFNYN